MSNETTKPVNAGFAKILPVMFAFFVMGFVDLVGTATNYVKAEFGLADGTANLFTTMVFFWFLIFSMPTGILMNKIGRRQDRAVVHPGDARRHGTARSSPTCCAR